ncbi:MAG: lysylphosphatidylglycerol synthase transmembrane domain-containing protein [Pseudomonadota bacterium]
MKKLIAGILIGIVLVYLSLRGIDFQEVANGFRHIRSDYVLLFLAVVFCFQLLRSFRWGLMLRPLDRVNQISLFSVSSVGFLAITSLPVRLGELARPYLITKKSQIKMTAALGTILVERVCDSIAILIIFGIALFFIPFLPPWLVRSALLVSLLTLIFLAVMIIMLVKREVALKALAPLINRLPERFAGKIDSLLHQLIDGFKIFNDFRLLLLVVLLSVLIWMINAASIYILFHAFAFNLSFTAATVTMIILLIGIAIPTAPGFIGNWHYACIIGLTLFNVSKSEALTFAVIYHFLSIGLVVVLGLIFLPFNKFSIADMKKEALSTHQAR